MIKREDGEERVNSFDPSALKGRTAASVPRETRDADPARPRMPGQSGRPVDRGGPERAAHPEGNSPEPEWLTPHEEDLPASPLEPERVVARSYADAAAALDAYVEAALATWDDPADLDDVDPDDDFASLLTPHEADVASAAPATASTSREPVDPALQTPVEQDNGPLPADAELLLPLELFAPDTSVLPTPSEAELDELDDLTVRPGVLMPAPGIGPAAELELSPLDTPSEDGAGWADGGADGGADGRRSPGVTDGPGGAPMTGEQALLPLLEALAELAPTPHRAVPADLSPEVPLPPIARRHTDVARVLDQSYVITESSVPGVRTEATTGHAGTTSAARPETTASKSGVGWRGPLASALTLVAVGFAWWASTRPVIEQRSALSRGGDSTEGAGEPETSSARVGEKSGSSGTASGGNASTEASAGEGASAAGLQGTADAPAIPIEVRGVPVAPAFALLNFLGEDGAPKYDADHLPAGVVWDAAKHQVRSDSLQDCRWIDGRERHFQNRPGQTFLYVSCRAPEGSLEGWLNRIAVGVP